MPEADVLAFSRARGRPVTQAQRVRSPDRLSFDVLPVFARLRPWGIGISRLSCERPGDGRVVVSGVEEIDALIVQRQLRGAPFLGIAHRRRPPLLDEGPAETGDDGAG